MDCDCNQRNKHALFVLCKMARMRGMSPSPSLKNAKQFYQSLLVSGEYLLPLFVVKITICTCRSSGRVKEYLYSIGPVLYDTIKGPSHDLPFVERQLSLHVQFCTIPWQFPIGSTFMSLTIDHVIYCRRS